MKPNRCDPQMMKNDQPVVLDGAVDLDQRKSLGCHIVILKCATPRVQCHLVAKIYPQVPDVQQMPLPGTWEAGEDLTQDPWPCHPWPRVLHRKTAECTCTGVPEEKPLVQTQKCFVLQHQGYQGSRPLGEKGLSLSTNFNSFHWFGRVCSRLGCFPTSWN